MRKTLSVLLLIVGTIFGAEVLAQTSSINTYSPYTFYGIGDFATQGSASQISMGGAGIAYRSTSSMNLLNSANLGNTGQRTVLFDVALEGANIYSKTETANTSYNTFNIRDIALQLSLANRMGVSISMTPYTEIGYRIELEESDPSILANIGQVKYLYDGEGGITQFKLGYGVGITKNISLGADFYYYHGTIKRNYTASITSTIQPTSTSSTYGNTVTNIARVMYGVGFQASPIYNNKRVLTFAGTYHLGGDLNPSTTSKITIGNLFADTISYGDMDYDYVVPGKLVVGTSYQTTKLSLSADYTYQNWEGANDDDDVNSVSYFNNNALRIGGEYTPDKGNIRSIFKRITYRAGFSTENYYVKVNDQEIRDRAVSVGVGFPMKYASKSTINLGAQFGQRGTIYNGLIRERYVKLSIGINFFGEDYWFMKYKYD